MTETSAKKTAAVKTAYHILEQIAAEQPPNAPNASSSTPVPVGPTFRLVASDLAASSAEHAIRQHAAKLTDTATLIAIPSRSWKPTKITLETKKVVTLTETT